MPCNNNCCPPHNFNANRDPLPSDCEDTPVVGYAGGYCKGSYWYNPVNGKLWIGANGMPCNNALWLNFTPETISLAHVRRQLGAWQSIPTGVETNLLFSNEMHDENGDWDDLLNHFTAPRNGYYEVKVIVRTSVDGQLYTTGWSLGESFHVLGKINGVLTANSGIGGSFMFQHASGSSQVFDRIHLVSSSTVKMIAGDIFTVDLIHYSATSKSFHPTNTQIIIDELPTLGVTI